MKKLFSLLMAVMLTATVAMAQHTVSGTVVSAVDDEPLPGATVQPVGGGVGVATDIDGHFTLTVPSSVKELKVSYIGMTTQTVAASGTNIVVKLSSALNNLDEVMVVAYGTAKKSAYTGSASVVKGEDLAGAMVTDAMSALKGTAAGVQVLSSSGQPGSSPTVLIRGIGSINAGTSPLYVVDGLPYNGDIAAMNTLDIESITVLKDAAASALYGARGANGVILITTKKGADREARVTFDGRWGCNSRQIKNYDVITSPDQYMEMAYQALYRGAYDTYNDAATANLAANKSLLTAFGTGYQFYTVPTGQLLIGTNGKLNPNATLGYSDGKNYYTPDNWADHSFRNGLRQEYNLSVSGGSDRYDYFISGGYLADEGIIIASDYNRLTARSAVNFQAKKWLKIGTDLSFSHVDTGYPSNQNTTNSGSNVALMAYTIAPVYPMFIRDADGKIMRDATNGRPIYDYGDGLYSRGVRNFYNKSNAISDLIYGDRKYLMDIFNGTWYATVTPITNLNVTGKVGYTLDNTRYHYRQSALYGQSASYGGINTQGAYHYRTLNLQALATYRNTFNNIHNLDYLLGYESYEYYTESTEAYGQTLYNPNNWAVDNTLDNDKRKGYGSAGTHSVRGIFGRINYDYDGKYFASVSYRRDASSRFAPDKRWGNFFSVSAAWDIKKEKFLQDVTAVDMIKVKASFGQQGNEAIGNYYAYQDQYGIQGVDQWSDGTLVYKGNKDLTWETSNNFNAGVDFSFFQGKIDGTAEFFLRQTSDMLYNKPVAPSMGYTSIPMNVGSMRNSGFEFEINYRPIANRDLNWEINVNGTFIRNKVLKLHPDLNGQLISGTRIIREGESLYQYYLVKYAGVNPENGNPLFWDKDEEGNEFKTEDYDSANANNRCATGNTLPTFYGGFGSSLKWKGIDFSFQFGFQLGGRVMDSGYTNLLHAGSTSDIGRNWHADMLKAWTPENTNTNIPALNSLATYDLAGTSTDFALTSSNYLSLNNVTLGYTLPKAWTSKLKIDEVRVFCAGENLYLWSKRKGLDPRQGFGYIDSNMSYAQARNISGGIHVVF